MDYTFLVSTPILVWQKIAMPIPPERNSSARNPTRNQATRLYLHNARGGLPFAGWKLQYDCATADGEQHRSLSPILVWP